MRLTLKLLLAHWRRHWFRGLLALASLVVSVAMVIVVVGGYDVAMSRAQAAVARAAKALGRFDLVVMSGASQDAQAARTRMGASLPSQALGAELLERLRGDSDVQDVFECCQARIEARPGGGAMFQYAMYRPGELMTCLLLGTRSRQAPYGLREGAWLSGEAENGVVLDGAVARMARTGVGGTVVLAGLTGRHEVTVCGILDSPGDIRGLAGIYVSPATFERLTGQSVETNRVLVDVKESGSADDVAERLFDTAARLHSAIHVETTRDLQAEAARWGAMPPRSATGFFPLLRDVEMYLAILAAMFMIFTTFSMGLRERTRQLAMLRAIGMSRRQVAAMVAAEAFVLAWVGWLGGMVLGDYLLRRSLAMPPDGGAGMELHRGLWLGIGAIVAFGATFLAAALPTLLAIRRGALEGMSVAGAVTARPVPRALPLVGLGLILINPVVACTDLVADPWRTQVVLPAGMLGAILGFAMLIPTLLGLCQGPFSRLGGWVFGLSRALLHRQLAANVWRTVGCTSALMVGLGLFITIQIWGHSMMVPFLVTSRSPDAVVTVFPDGAPDDKLPAVAALEGVQTVLPMILEHPSLADEAGTPTAGMFFSRDLIYIGCNVHALFDAEGMIAATFVRGQPQEAFARLEQGGCCLVTDSLYLRAPELYDVGKTLLLDTLEEPRRTVAHTIVGVVDIPGWHLLTKSAQMRRGLGRVGGMVFVPTPTARSAYPQARHKAFWFQMNDGADPASLDHAIVRIVDPHVRPARATSRPGSRPASPGQGRGEGVAARRGGDAGRGPRQAGQGAPPVQPLDSPVYCRVVNTRAMVQSIRQRAQGIIEAMTMYPLIALGLASLAVVSTMMVSVRVRSWEIGVLRSLGLTRGQVVRLVLAEGFLMALLACATSLLFGLLASWVGITASSRSMAVIAPFEIPWLKVTMGVGAAVVMSLAASVWPAVTTAMRQPLGLLQEGRTSQ